MSLTYEEEQAAVEQLRSSRARVDAELGKVIVGQKDDGIEQLLVALFAGGHCLLTGAPGLAKTLLVKSHRWQASCTWTSSASSSRPT
jgi:MoxR-like ATPase